VKNKTAFKRIVLTKQESKMVDLIGATSKFASFMKSIDTVIARNAFVFVPFLDKRSEKMFRLYKEHIKQTENRDIDLIDFINVIQPVEQPNIEKESLWRFAFDKDYGPWVKKQKTVRITYYARRHGRKVENKGKTVRKRRKIRDFKVSDFIK
jgi:hypothetical protein